MPEGLYVKSVSMRNVIPWPEHSPVKTIFSPNRKQSLERKKIRFYPSSIFVAFVVKCLFLDTIKVILTPSLIPLQYVIFNVNFSCFKILLFVKMNFFAPFSRLIFIPVEKIQSRRHFSRNSIDYSENFAFNTQCGITQLSGNRWHTAKYI